MDRRMVVELIILIGKIGMVVSGFLFFFSFNSFMKDVNRRVELAEQKDKKRKEAKKALIK